MAMERRVEDELMERMGELAWWQRIWVMLKLSGPGYL